MNKYQKYTKYTYKATRFLAWVIIVIALVTVGSLIYYSTLPNVVTPELWLLSNFIPFIKKIIFSVLLIIIAARIKKSQLNIEKVKKELIALLILNIIALLFGGGLFALIIIIYSGLTVHYINKFKKEKISNSKEKIIPE